VQTRLERSVQCEDSQSRADQRPGDGLEIITAAHLRLALVAEIARPQAETRFHRIPAFGAKVGLVENDFHLSSGEGPPERKAGVSLELVPGLLRAAHYISAAMARQHMRHSGFSFYLR